MRAMSPYRLIIDHQQESTFLVSIGADLSSKRDTSETVSLGEAKSQKQHPLVLSEVLDKVVQDITGEEGTGIWSNTEAIELHVPAFTLNVAHAFRLASAYRGDREQANKVSGGGFPPSDIEVEDKKTFIEDLRKATYISCLASFIQGFNIIARADEEHKWGIDYAQVWQIWRAGCIIQADYISDNILSPILNSKPSSADLNLNLSPRVAEDVKKCYPALRRVVAKVVETDQVAPAISTTLEYFKVVTGTDLPTSFYEAELDYFGSHMFDEKSERDNKDVQKPMEGKHHFEWKPATSQKEVYGKTY